MHKRSVVRTLTSRVKWHVTTAEDKKAELAHVHEALIANNNPECWIYHFPSAKEPPQRDQCDKTPGNQSSMLGIPYVAGLSEQLNRVYKAHGVHIYHKPANTLHSKLVHPKDKTPMEQQCRTILYHITCDNDPDHTYIGETKQPLHQRFKEHRNLDYPTGVGDHYLATGHPISIQNVKTTTIAVQKSEGGHLHQTENPL